MFRFRNLFQLPKHFLFLFIIGWLLFFPQSSIARNECEDLDNPECCEDEDCPNIGGSGWEEICINESTSNPSCISRNCPAPYATQCAKNTCKCIRGYSVGQSFGAVMTGSEITCCGCLHSPEGTQGDGSEEGEADHCDTPNSQGRSKKCVTTYPDYNPATGALGEPAVCCVCSQ